MESKFNDFSKHRKPHHHHEHHDEMDDFNEIFELILFALLYGLEILWKPVASVPVVTVVVDAPAYKHGDTVNISGTVLIDSVPQVGTSVAISLEDFLGKATDLGSVATDANGAFTASYVVAADVAAGAVTVTASALATTVITTFTRNI